MTATNPVNEAWETYRKARATYEEIHAESSKAHREMENAKHRLVDSLIDSGQKAVAFEDGCSVNLRRAFRISVTKDNEWSIREWANQAVGSDKQFEKTALDKPALTEYLKERVEKGEMQASDVPDFFKLKTSPDLQVNGWNR